MNSNLPKYLSDVLRNEVQHKGNLENKERNLQASGHLLDRNHNQFIVDKRFSLRLDEIV
jgi:hypothetical protein